MGEELAVENGRISYFQGLVTLTLTLDRVILHTVMHHPLTYTYTPNFIEIEETFKFMNLLQNLHLAVIEYLYPGRRAVPLQTFTTRHNNRRSSTVIALSTNFMQFASETTKFNKISQNKGHFAVEGH